MVYPQNLESIEPEAWISRKTPTFDFEDLLKQQKKLLDLFFSSIDPNQIEKVFEKIISSKGSVILSGVGKSGYIAAKIAATLSSTGTKAHFLSPTDALHGDIGRAVAGDVAILLSKSGESIELVHLAAQLKKKNIECIAVTSAKDSQLKNICDEAVLLPMVRELCPYNLAPTTSTTAQMIFGDCLAVALMKAKQFSCENFAENHPAGLIGRKITHTVRSLMRKGDELPLCHPDALLLDVLHELSSKRCGCVLAVNGEGLQGIFTDGDLRRTLEKFGAAALSKQVKEVMSHTPKTIEENELIHVALEKMEQKDPVMALPVLSNGRPVGLIHMHDILQKGL